MFVSTRSVVDRGLEILPTNSSSVLFSTRTTFRTHTSHIEHGINISVDVLGMIRQCILACRSLMRKGLDVAETANGDDLLSAVPSTSSGLAVFTEHLVRGYGSPTVQRDHRGAFTILSATQTRDS